MEQPPTKRTKTEIEADILVYGCDDCDAKFVSKIKSTEHLIRIHKQSINVLPIEVFENILDFLHPNDLVEMGQTNHNYKDLVADYFERKRQCGRIEIISKGGCPKIRCLWKKKYEIYFRSIIRNIVIVMSINDPITEMFEFIKEKCSKNIHSLMLDNWDISNSEDQDHVRIKINESHMAIIGEQIKHLTDLVLGSKIDCNIQWDRFKRLRILCDELHGGQSNWMTNKLPNLSTLCLLGGGWNEIVLKDFIQNHMQIDTLFVRNFTAISSVLSSNIKFSNAVFRNIGEDDTAELLNQIKKYYTNVTSFDLEIHSIDRATFRQIAAMEKVEKLHIEIMDRDLAVIGNIRLPHIQRLCITMLDPTTKNALNLIKKSFFNLHKLWIYHYEGSSEMSPNEILTILVDALPKLKHLHVKCYEEFDGRNYDLHDWTSARLSMKNASPVTVHIEERYILEHDCDSFKRNNISFKIEEDTACRNRPWLVENYLDLVKGLRH